MNFKFRLSCGDETTRVCVCHPPQADTATHLRSTKPTEARACRDVCMSRVGSTSALLTKISMLMHTKTKFCDVVEPNGRNPSSSYAALASHWTAILFGLNCMFALLVGGPLGHVAHLHTSSIQGPWWATGSFTGLVGSVRLGQRWKGPWSLRASRASRVHKYHRRSGEPRNWFFTKFCLSSLNCWLLSKESRPHLLHHLPAKWLKSGLSGCFKQAEACCREGNANKRHGC